MSNAEEVKTEQTEVKQEAQPEVKQEVQQETQERDYEAEAREMGWKPKEEYDGENDKWVPAKEYVDRKPLYDQIRKMRRSQKDLEQTVQQLADHNRKVEEVAYKRALETLKAEKAEALEQGEHKKVVELDEQIADLKQNRPVAPTKGPSPEFVEWVAENPWYNTDPELKEQANIIGLGYEQRHPKSSPEEAFAHVTKMIKKMYPEKFQNTRRTAPATVESTRPAPVKAKEPTFDDLTDAQKSVALRFERQGIMSRKDYVAELVKLGEVKKGA